MSIIFLNQGATTRTEWERSSRSHDPCPYLPPLQLQTCHISKRSWKHHNSDTDQVHVVCHWESSSARAWCVFTAQRWDGVAKEDSTWNIDLLVDFERKSLRDMK